MAQIRSKPFGVTKEGANVTEYILSNPGGLTVSVLDFGCVIKRIISDQTDGHSGDNIFYHQPFAVAAVQERRT